MATGIFRRDSSPWLPQASVAIAYLVIETLTGLVLISCLFYVRSFRWLFRGLTDRTRTYVFITSILATIIYFVVDLTATGVAMEGTPRGFKWNIIVPLIEISRRISEFSILFVVIRTVNLLISSNYGTPDAPPKPRIFTLALLGAMGTTSFIAFALTAAFRPGGPRSFVQQQNLLIAISSFNVISSALYLVAAIYLFAMATLGMKRLRSKASLIISLVAMSLLLRSIFYLVHLTNLFFFVTEMESLTISRAGGFIYDLTTVVIYVGVTAVARIGSGFDEMPKGNQEQELSPFATPHVYE